ncbi:MAG TPA: hypothetical protein VN836_12075 [Verrucomicrobiae bacterium]|nr:hypothetical protein [Verrucomicrobiae bacterium]
MSTTNTTPPSRRCELCRAFYPGRNNSGTNEGICIAFRCIKKVTDSCRHYMAKASAPVKAVDSKPQAPA